MDSYITDEKTGIEYKLVGDYYLPMIKAPETPEIGMWGQRYIRYLRENKKAIYTAFLISGKLYDHAAEIDRSAEEMYEKLIREMTERDGITEDLKARDQLAWIGAMNNIAARAREIVENKLIII
ncbi:MAG: TnpV protein [Clostridia bacterium]|nr:TnpV protein [Clostridia bacterium]